MSFIWDHSKKVDQWTEDSTKAKTNKIKPFAEIDSTNGEDGREPTRYYVSYRCPHCYKYLDAGTIGCADCGIFFDWSQRAEIVVKREIVWR